MDTDQKKIAELKEKHGTLYEGEITYADRENSFQRVRFLFREPNHADAEATAAGAVRDPLATNQNLLASLIVFPEPGKVIDQLREVPLAVGKFIDAEIVPFFGGGPATTTRKRKI